MVAAVRAVPGHARHLQPRAVAGRAGGGLRARAHLGSAPRARPGRRRHAAGGRRRLVRARGLPRPRADDDRARTRATPSWRRRPPNGAAFTAGDLRDLQVWQKLAWVDPDVLATDPRARRLVGKGRGFDEHDKRALRAVELELLRAGRAGLPRGRRGAATWSSRPRRTSTRSCRCCATRRRTTPRTRAAPLPRAAVPAARGRGAAAAAARWRRTRAGSACGPPGVWPSEGSVSRSARRPRWRGPGFRWMASDEGILARSPSPAPLPRRRALPAARAGRRRPGKSACCSATTRCRTSSASPIRAGTPRTRSPTSSPGCARPAASRRRAWRRQPGGAGDPRRRERLGALPGWRPAVPASALPRPGRRPPTSSRSR